MARKYRGYVGFGSGAEAPMYEYATDTMKSGILSMSDKNLDTPQGSYYNTTGGTILLPGNGYRYHVFTHPSCPGPEPSSPYPDPVGMILGDLTTPTNPTGTCDVLVVSGGGGGGSGYYGGGGGGGTVVVGTGLVLPVATYAIQVGGRGDPGPYPPGPTPGGDGGKSVFGAIDILGGGYGGSGPGGTSLPGSTTGGNAGGRSTYTSGGTSNPYSIPAPYGPYGTWTVNLNPRPSATPGWGGDGAGGGSPARIGGVGVAVPQFPGPLFPQLSDVTTFMGPTNSYYGGGGGGLGYHPYPNPGGYGGGGTAAPSDLNTPGPTVTPLASVAGRGKNYLGGGGGGSGNGRGHGGQGGAGIVIIRYAV